MRRDTQIRKVCQAENKRWIYKKQKALWEREREREGEWASVIWCRQVWLWLTTIKADSFLYPTGMQGNIEACLEWPFPKYMSVLLHRHIVCHCGLGSCFKLQNIAYIYIYIYIYIHTHTHTHTRWVASLKAYCITVLKACVVEYYERLTERVWLNASDPAFILQTILIFSIKH